MELTSSIEDALGDCAEEGTASVAIVASLRALRSRRRPDRETRRAIDALIARATGR